MAEGSYQIDLEELIDNYIWKRFKEDKGFLRGLFYRRNNYYIDIRWGFVEFKHETKHTVRPIKEEPLKQNVQLYCTEYENKTDEKQSYKFATSRATTATTRIELQENYTIGAETNVEVDLAGIVKVGGGINGSFSVTETKGEEYSETLNWNIDTDIVVPPMKMAKGSLNVMEKPILIDFTTTSTISLPQKKLPVSVRRLKDRKEIQMYWIENLTALFDEDILRKGNVRIEDKFINENEIEEVVVLTTRGVCRNTSWSNQHVEVEFLDLKNSPKKGDKPVADESEKDGGENDSGTVKDDKTDD